MRLQKSKFFGTGICPMCRKPTHRNVHQSCGIAREQAKRIARSRRHPVGDHA